MEAALQTRTDVSLMTPVSSLEALFDKRVTSRAWESMSLRVPRATRVPVRTLSELLEAMREAQMKQPYVKVSSGSSAALLALGNALGDFFPGHVVDARRVHAHVMDALEERGG